MAIEMMKTGNMPTDNGNDSECQDCEHLRARIRELEARLEERKIIEKAKWILVKQKGVTEEEALELLRSTARFNQKKIVDVANDLVLGEKILKGSCPGF